MIGFPSLYDSYLAFPRTLDSTKASWSLQLLFCGRSRVGFFSLRAFLLVCCFGLVLPSLWRLFVFRLCFLGNLGTLVGALVRPSPCCGGRLSFCKHFVNIFLTLLVFGRFASCSPHASSGSFFGLYALYMCWGGGIGCADWKSGKK